MTIPNSKQFSKTNARFFLNFLCIDISLQQDMMDYYRQNIIQQVYMNKFPHKDKLAIKQYSPQR